MRYAGLSVIFCLAFLASGYSESIAVWNFNDAVSGTTGGATEFLVDRGSGSMTSNFATASVGNTGGTTLGGLDGDAAGYSLRLSGMSNNGKNLTWMLSTTGLDSICVSFAAMRTSTGFSENAF